MYELLDCLCEKFKINYNKDVSMKKYTSFKIGGKSDRLLEVETYEQLQELTEFFANEKMEFFILGNGSNLLVTDKGIRVPVVKLGDAFKKICLIDDTTIKCGAAASLTSLCNFAKDNSLTGLEFAFGIPGTAGGAAYMNAGAYGGEMKDVLYKCEHYFHGEKGEFSNSELDLSYRRSVYSEKEYLITDLFLKLKKGIKTDIAEKMNGFMNSRKEKQPLNFPSAGSTFKRPVGYFAAALIEECGLKGVCVGDACVSEKHSGFVINKGNANSDDVLLLIDLIKKKVFEEKAVKLECEIKVVGELV